MPVVGMNMNTDTFFLFFCLTIVVLGVVTSPASADNTTTTTQTTVATTATTVPTTIATTVATTATTVPTTVATTVATTVTTVPATVATTVATTTAVLPTVTSISPVSGPLAGSNAVIILGSGFSNGAGASNVNYVTFGSTESGSYTFISDTEITAPAPAEAAGTVNIIVTTGTGTSAISTADQYTYSATAASTLPAVTGVSPAYGPVSVSTPVTITGTGFTGATGVTIGGTAATSVVVVSASEITAATPASTTVGQVDVLVTTPNGTSGEVAGDKYTFAAAASSIPVPVFSATPTSGIAPLEVSFEDESTGSPASWSWNFGDGNTSTLENPSNTYANNGTYTVTLTEQNSQGENATTETGYITVGGSGPAADFTATPTSGIVPQSVQFTDTSTGSPTSWLWNFGDGTTGSDENPSHVYTSPGVYSVTLSASNSIGSTTFTQPDAITVSSGAPVSADTNTQAATQVPTPGYTYPTSAATYQIPETMPQASGTDSSAWVEQENHKMTALDTETPANASGLPAAISLISIAGVALFFRKKQQ
jgi:PKD repeat protein